MATRKQSPKPEAAIQPSPPGLTTSRPQTPGSAYGVPTSGQGLLPWSYVSERMAAAKCYWIGTVGPNAQPHATPVDGVWLDEVLYFGGSPETRRSRNLIANPATCVHLENGLEVVILHGQAQAFSRPEQALAVRLSEATIKKYGYGPQSADYEKVTGAYVFRPRVVFAWKQFPNDVTRWRLP